MKFLIQVEGSVISIDIDDGKKPSDNWINDAESVTKELLAASSDEDRKKIIESNKKLWGKDSEVKKFLKEKRNGKCWYCESKYVRASYDVDHYRPKGAIFEDENHNGYWWLAFDWRNYRYSCQYCNRLLRDTEKNQTFGKGTHFPLMPSSERACNPSDNCRLEKPYLLDPTNASDLGLLWFEQDGKCVPKYDKDRYFDFYERARISIDVYNLNESGLQEDRMDVIVEVENCIKDADEHWTEYVNGDGSAQKGFGTAVKKLEKMKDKDSKYSSTVQAILLGYREPDRVWIDRVL